MRGTRAKKIRRFAKQISNGVETLVEGKIIRRHVIQKFTFNDDKIPMSETIVREFTKNSFKPILKAAKRGWNQTGTDEGMIHEALGNLRNSGK